MKKYIKSHGYLNYNINPRGTNTGDCQTRAVAMAFGLTWDEARKRLRKIGNDWYNRAFLVRKALKDEFGCTQVDIDLNNHSEDTDYLSVAEFCDTVGKSGTYLVVCNPDVKQDYGTHLVCTINGTIYDTWNSSKSRVIEVYKPSGSYRKDELQIESDIPDTIWKIALKYERCFYDTMDGYDFNSKLKQIIPSLSNDDVRNIVKNISVSAELDTTTIHSFNFVIDIKPNIRIYQPVSYKLTRKKPCNISFNTDETKEDALSKMDSTVYSIVDSWFLGVINQIKERMDISEDLGNLRNHHLTAYQLEAYKSVSPEIRKYIVHMETFCGYIGASILVGDPNTPFRYLLVLCETYKYLDESIRICLKYDYDYWNDYHTSTINVLPHGFVYKLAGSYYNSYSEDKKDFKAFMDSYDEYLWDKEHGAGHDLEWYFSSWDLPEFLK